MDFKKSLFLSCDDFDHYYEVKLVYFKKNWISSLLMIDKISLINSFWQQLIKYFLDVTFEVREQHSNFFPNIKNRS